MSSKASEVRDNKGVSEFNFIENVKLMAQLFYAREKKEKVLLIYDWKLFWKDMKSKDSHLRPFFNILEKLINSNGWVLQIKLSCNDKKDFLSYVIFLQKLEINILAH